MKRTPVLHPFLFAAVPALFLFAHNARRLHLSPAELPLPLALAVGFALVAWLALRPAFRSGAKAGLVVTLFLALFFGWGHVPGPVAAVLFPLLFAAGCVLVARSRRVRPGLTVFLNAAAAVLVALNLGLGLPALLRPRVPARPLPAPAPGLPDIYYIIPDGHGRSDILAELYGHDNSGFIAGLRERGFFVADRARSSYSQTYLALGSALNMTHLDSLAEAVGRDSDDRGPLVRFLLANRVMGELRGRGYAVVSFASGYSGTGFEDAEHHLAPPRALSEYRNLLIALTPLAPLLALTDRCPHELHRERVEYTLDRLPDAAGRTDRPAFVIAHLLSPHPPFVFGPHGERVQVAGPFSFSDGNHFHHNEPEPVARYVEGYRGQVRYVERRLLETVDRVLAGSERPPVIIIHADHGPGSRLHHDDPRWTCFDERQAILWAVLMPDREYPGWPDSVTTANTFRLVFNRLFGDTLELLPDRSRFATWDRPYRHYDVDDWRAPEYDVPEQVAVIAFQQADVQPARPETYFARLVGRRLPGAGVGPVLLYLVDSLPTVEEAYARYRAAVRDGVIPDLGEDYEHFTGNHGSDWRKVLALYFPCR